MKTDVIQLPVTEYWEREETLVTITVVEDPAPTVPMPRTRHRDVRRSVWHGITGTRWGWYVLLTWTFTVSFIITLEILAIEHHVSF